FGKSKILRMVTKELDTICNHIPNNFESSCSINGEVHSKPYYHDATTAGMIAAAKSTKFFVIDEAEFNIDEKNNNINRSLLDPSDQDVSLLELGEFSSIEAPNLYSTISHDHTYSINSLSCVQLGWGVRKSIMSPHSPTPS
ncbi:unnamed protein product, partial [Adineta steineri]